ncbi:hypothetical protein B0H14DRAFT_2579246 [Mycena olivaceomarginata]|nr:hypothetical protein B0H14DRAFT_2579246 [Mycena olivaceomarginata]
MCAFFPVQRDLVSVPIVLPSKDTTTAHRAEERLPRLRGPYWTSSATGAPIADVEALIVVFKHARSAVSMPGGRSVLVVVFPEKNWAVAVVVKQQSHGVVTIVLNDLLWRGNDAECSSREVRLEGSGHQRTIRTKHILAGAILRTDAVKNSRLVVGVQNTAKVVAKDDHGARVRPCCCCSVREVGVGLWIKAGERVINQRYSRYL